MIVQCVGGPGLHDDAPRRETTQCVASTETEETNKGFHLEPWIEERDHIDATKRGATPTGSAAAGDRSTMLSPGASHLLQHLPTPRVDMPPPNQTSIAQSRRCHC